MVESLKIRDDQCHTMVNDPHRNRRRACEGIEEKAVKDEMKRLGSVRLWTSLKSLKEVKEHFSGLVLALCHR